MELSKHDNNWVLTFTEEEELPIAMWSDLVKWRADHKCQTCVNGANKTASGKSVLRSHHIVPSKLGGLTTLSNGMCVCIRCHGVLHSNSRPTRYNTKYHTTGFLGERMSKISRLVASL